MTQKYQNPLIRCVLGSIAITPALTFALDITSIGTNAQGQSWDTAEDWSDSQPATVGNDYTITSGFTIRTPEGSGNFVFPGNSLAIATGGTLGLKNKSAITVNIVSTGGQISHFSNSLSPDNAVVRGTVFLAGDLIFNPSLSARIISLESAVSGTGSITKKGSGTLVLSSANNKFSGATVIEAGTIRLTGGDNRLPASNLLDFAGTSTLDVTNTTQTLSRISTPGLTDVNLTVKGAGGSLIVDGASALQIGPGGAGAVTAGIAVDMDLSGLSSFAYDNSASTFRVGLKSGAQNSGNLGNVATVTLAASNNITANLLAIGDVAANNDGGDSTLNLGTTNDLRLNTLSIGYSGRSNAIFGFAAGLTNPTATIRDTDGTSALGSWLVGNAGTFSNSTWSATVDMTAGTLDAKVTNLTVGSAQIGSQTSRGGTENGTFSMGKGTLEATTITLGSIGGSSASGVGSSLNANGTFSLSHADGIVRATTLRFAQNTIASASGTKTASGIFNLINGTLEAQDIQLGSQSGTATASSALNWTNGTIRNLSGSNLTIDSVPVTLIAGTHTFEATSARTITVNSTAPIGGSGGIVKTGSGTLQLNAENAYSGNTDVNEGTLLLGNSASLASGSAVNVSTGASFGGGGTVNGSATIQGIHTPGFSPGAQTFTNSLAYSASSTLQWDFVGDTLASAGADYDVVTVTGGNLSLTAGATLALLASGVDYSQAEWSGARDFTVIDFSGGGSSDGNFLLDTSLAGSFEPYGTWSTSNTGGDIILSWAPIPEPSSALLAAVMSSLFLTRRRR